MDRNTVIGFSLIFLILAGYYWYTAPTAEERQQMIARNDSIAKIEVLKKDSLEKIESQNKTEETKEASNNAFEALDSLNWTGEFASHRDTRNSQVITIANSSLTINVNSLGGSIESVKLNEFKRSDSSDLILLDSGKNNMVWSWTNSDGEPYSSDKFNWTVHTKNDSQVVMRLYADSLSYIEQYYNLHNSQPYVLDYHVRMIGMGDNVRRGNSDFRFDWSAEIQKQERDKKWEHQHSALVYKLPEESPTSLKTTDGAKEEVKSRMEWFGFKQQYFAAIMASASDIANDAQFEMGENNVEEGNNDIKPVHSTIYTEFAQGEELRDAKFSFYFGPTQYDILQNANIGVGNAELEKIVPLGWGIFGWVNRGLVLPIFSWLSSIIGEMGIAILLLTVIIKTILLPLVYKSYISTAKMRILKPEIDAIKEKHGNDMQKTQQENMALYKKAGVNPMSGCIPMLLQLPILFAMFQFFPVAFELRQKSFLWAQDLSQFDGPSLGFSIPFYGDHVSFFTLMMTVSTIIYTHFNNQITGVSGQMKYIGYFMPVIFLGVLNDYASGLTWYYFVSNIITFTQQFVIRKTVDDSKLHKQIEDSRKKPAKKSAFQKRMEDAMRISQERAKKKR